MFPSSFPLLATLLLSLAAVLAAPYNVTLNSTSPLISYTPSRTGEIAQTWNVSYTGSSWSTWANQTIGQGQSYHYTTHVGSGASLSWYGVGAYIFGSAADGAASVTVDGASTGVLTAPGVLGYVTGLPAGWHNLSVAVQGSRGVNITGAVVTYDILGADASFRNNTPIEALWNGNNINAALDTSNGTWEVATLTGGGGNSPQLTYNHIDTHTPGSQLTLQPPSDTSLVILQGLSNYDHGPYSVRLHHPDGSLATGMAPAIQNFTGYSPWIGMDEVLYIGVLNSTLTYQITVEFLGKSTEYWDLGRVLFITATGSGSGSSGGSTSGSKGTNVGAIAGGVVGGIVAIAVIVALLGYFVFGWCRKRKEQTSKPEVANGSPFEIDRYEETTLTSPIAQRNYFDDPQTAYAQAASGSHPALSNSPRDSATQITPLLLSGSDGPVSEYSNPYDTPPQQSSYNFDGASSDEKRPIALPTRGSPSASGIRPTSGLTLANATLGDGMSIAGSSQAEGEKSRRRSGPINPSRRPEEFTLERDAGRFVMPTEHGGTVPPSYDPAWREERGNARLAEDGYSEEEEDRQSSRRSSDQR